MSSLILLALILMNDEKQEEANKVFKKTVSDNTQSLSRLDDANNLKQI